MADERPQKMAKAARAGHTSGVSRFWEKMTPAKTKRFFTHCRGRIERTTAVTRFTSPSRPPASLTAPLRPHLPDTEEADREVELIFVGMPIHVLRRDREALEAPVDSHAKLDHLARPDVVLGAGVGVEVREDLCGDRADQVVGPGDGVVARPEGDSHVPVGAREVRVRVTEPEPVGVVLGV